jgi:hypothetical protein
MPLLPQVACHSFAWKHWCHAGQFLGQHAGGTPALPGREIPRGTKKSGLAKNFSSQRAGLVLQFSQMKNPGLIWEIGSCNLHFPTGHFKRPS